VKDDSSLSTSGPARKYDNTLRAKIKHFDFAYPVVLFTLAFILRMIPELMVGKYPIGNDTIAHYAPYIAKFRFDLLNMVYWGHPTSWLLMKATYALVSDVYVTLKIIGSVLYGFFLISFYVFLTSLGWSHKKSLWGSLFLLVQVPALRLFWDLFHNALGLSFMLLAMSELGRITRTTGNPKKLYVKFAILSLLTALTHQMMFFLLVSITTLWVIRSFFKRSPDSRIRVLLGSLAPALFAFILIVVSVRIGPPTTENPFRILYREPLMEQAATHFFVNYLDFFSYPELFNHISLTFVVAYAPLIPLALVGCKNQKLSSILRYCTILTLLFTFSPLLTGVSLFNWDRWMWLLVFPLSVYAFNGIGVVNERISRLKSRHLLRKSAKIGFSLIMALSFLFLCFVYVSRPQSDPFVLYGNFPSMWYLPETMRKTSIPFEYIPDLEDCVRWLDTNIRENSALLFESQFSGFVLLNLTPRSNMTLISYYSKEFGNVLKESLDKEFDFIYLIWCTKAGMLGIEQRANLLEVYAKGSFSVYARPRQFNPQSLAESANLLLFKNETYIEVPHSESLSAQNLTFEFWAKPTSFTSWARWMGESAFTSDKKEGWEIMWTDSPEFPSITLVMWDENGSERRSPFMEVTLNEWTHIAFTFNGSHIAGYRNGNVDGITEVRDWSPLPSKKPLHVGKAYDETYYDGFFAEFRFYNRSLSTFEVANNLLGNVAKDGLVLEFDFIDRDLMIMQDLSGEGNNGIIITRSRG